MATITRAGLQRGDIAHWDGLTKTTSRSDATGGSVTGLTIGESVDVLQVYGFGTDRTRTTIANALARIASSSVTLIFATGTWTIDSSLTIPANFSCIVPAGCVFDVSSGQTLTFSGPVFRESTTISSGAGTLILGADSTGDFGRTAAEVAASVTPTNYHRVPGEVRRQANNTTPGTTNVATGFQSAINAASATDPQVIVHDQMGISTPLILSSSSQQNLSIVGSGRVTAMIQPLAADIKVSPQSVNCCVFNQHNNGHFHLERVRFWAVAAFTGVAIYCVEGGGSDASGQALFSAVMRDIWCDFPTTNGGFLTGAMQNTVVDTATFEGCKGVFNLQGVGSGDCHFSNISLYNCFDHFILQTTDTNGSTEMSICGLHAYSHNRGVLIDVRNWNGGTIDDVILEPLVGNLGSVGIAHIKNSTNVVLSNLIAVARTDVPQANVALEFEATTGVVCSAKVINSKIDAAVGVLLTGVGEFDLELENVDFTNSATACIQVNGNCSGTLRTRNCKFLDSQQRAVLHSVLNGLSWISTNDEFLNAGMDGNAGRRVIDVATSGVVRLINPTIGRDDLTAAAAFFIEAGGSGTVDIINPRIVGTPPTGLKTGAQTVNIDWPRGLGTSIASAAALTIPNAGDVFSVSGTTSITSIVAANQQGRRVTLLFLASLTFTAGSNLVLAGAANFSATASDTITLVCDGTNWYEISRSANA